MDVSSVCCISVSLGPIPQEVSRSFTSVQGTWALQRSRLQVTFCHGRGQHISLDLWFINIKATFIIKMRKKAGWIVSKIEEMRINLKSPARILSWPRESSGNRSRVPISLLFFWFGTRACCAQHSSRGIRRLPTSCTKCVNKVMMTKKRMRSSVQCTVYSFSLCPYTKRKSHVFCVCLRYSYFAHRDMVT